MLVEIIKVKGQKISSRRSLQGFDADEQRSVGSEVDAVLGARDENGERHILAVAG